jgi:hypothetical protein
VLDVLRRLGAVFFFNIIDETALAAFQVRDALGELIGADPGAQGATLEWQRRTFRH